MSDYPTNGKGEIEPVIPNTFDGEDLSPTHAVSAGLHDGLKTLIQYGFAFTLGAVLIRAITGKKAEKFIRRL